MKFNLKKYILAFGIASVLLPSCNDDFMERYPLDEITDESFWKTETDLKLMLNSLYPLYIIGHQSGWAQDKSPALNVTGSPLMYGDFYSDNCVKTGNEPSSLAGELIVPTGASATNGWNWDNLRKVNFFLSHSKKQISIRKRKMHTPVKLIFSRLGNITRKFFFSEMCLGSYTI